ncbi:MAG: hypothetical protein C5B52_02915 [Bacteroidetes bacterium]|nr:MAG: hypothetical protein C5B52_02915 [Bacteroidota bacterium]
MKIFRVAIIILFLVSTLACKKESFITAKDASLEITADTLHFDTVFTTVGSVTQVFTIINTNSEKLRLSSVKLMGGANSSFHINVDGFPRPEVNNIDIAPEDSIYVFVTVTIDQNSSNLPFIVQDSILVDYNGNQKKIQLQAFGQNAHFLRSQKITGSTNWTNDLPYVILGGVLVDSNATLTIDAGTRVYMHADAPFLVDGILITNGTKSDSITFQGDRLDKDYRDLPASWPGIYLRGNSRDNVFTHTLIKNSYQGIVLTTPSPNANPKLTLQKCTLDNIYDIGILSLNSSIHAENCLISNCGTNLVLAQGGNYDFTYCTVATYGNLYIEHKNPVLFLNNWDSSGSTLFTYDLNANFTNCIFWGDLGNVDDEVITSHKGANIFNINFDHVLFKAVNDPEINSISVIRNQDPLFDSIDVNKRYFDFHITQKLSPAIGAGIPNSILTDMDDKTRTATPTLGCFEK